jgi:hypothetical protein
VFRRQRARRSTDDLERRLRAYGQAAEVPEPPDFATRVESRLRARPERPRRLRAPLAVAAVVATAAVAAVAVPASRSAVLQFLGLESVRVVTVVRLPPTRLRTPADFGRRVTLARARDAVRFTIALPGGAHPDKAFYLDDPPGGRVTLIYGSVRRPRLLVTEFRGSGIGPEVLKGATRGVPATPVSVGGDRGIWIGGAHFFRFVDDADVVRGERTFLVGRALVWEHGGVTYRIEGELTLPRALRIAREFH